MRIWQVNSVEKNCIVTLLIWVNVPIELAQYLQEIVWLRCLLNEETQFMSWQKSSIKESKMCLKMLICVFYHTCEIKTADQLVLCRHFIRKVWMKMSVFQRTRKFFWLTTNVCVTMWHFLWEEKYIS